MWISQARVQPVQPVIQRKPVQQPVQQSVQQSAPTPWKLPQSKPVSSKPELWQSQQLQGAILSGLQPQQMPSVALVSIPLPHIPVGGCLTHFLDFWRTLTSDREILQTVSGLKIDFIEHVYQTNPAPPLVFTPEEELATDKEIKSLLERGAIVQSVHEEGEFISNVFLHQKKTGGYRMILNLKKLNKYV